MKNNELLLEIIDGHLQELNKDAEQRAKCIEELIDFLQYNLRITKLTPEEKEDFYYCNEGYPFRDNQKKTIDGCKTQKEIDCYIDMWARATYFRRCAWMSYLFGETLDKPSLPDKV